MRAAKRLAALVVCYGVGLLQFLIPEIEHLGEDVVTGVATIDAMVAVGVVVHVELLVGLHEGLGVLDTVADVYIVVGHAMHEEQTAVEVVGTADG